MAGLPREVLRWLQSLDLTQQIKVPKWDLSNGYLIAEIFSWYYPTDITMHSYNNGVSLDSKQRNWHLLKNFIKKYKLDIPEEMTDGTIHCKEGASMILIRRIYQILTNRSINDTTNEAVVDYTDRGYQDKLQMHARSTASMAIKSNLKGTELKADRSVILSQQKSQKIINNHIEYRRYERTVDPDRFDIKPTLGERAIRRPPPPTQLYSEDSTMKSKLSHSRRTSAAKNKQASPSRENTETQFKELEVNQLPRPSNSMQTPVYGQ